MDAAASESRKREKRPPRKMSDKRLRALGSRGAGSGSGRSGQRDAVDPQSRRSAVAGAVRRPDPQPTAAMPSRSTRSTTWSAAGNCSAGKPAPAQVGCCHDPGRSGFRPGPRRGRWPRGESHSPGSRFSTAGIGIRGHARHGKRLAGDRSATWSGFPVRRTKRGWNCRALKKLERRQARLYCWISKH